MYEISVILNPNARKFRRGRSSIDSYTDIEYKGLRIFVPADLNELEKITLSLALNKPDYICIGGGDGTIHLVITMLIRSFINQIIPPILILREGTMNNVARSISLKGKGPNKIIKLIRSLENDKSFQIYTRDTIKINNNYCFLFGTGFVTN